MLSFRSHFFFREMLQNLPKNIIKYSICNPSNNLSSLDIIQLGSALNLNQSDNFYTFNHQIFDPKSWSYNQEFLEILSKLCDENVRDFREYYKNDEKIIELVYEVLNEMVEMGDKQGVRKLIEEFAIDRFVNLGFLGDRMPNVNCWHCFLEYLF